MKHKNLSPLEQEIMEIVWALGTCSVRNVLDPASKKKRLAYTTVATILQRLYEKGLVTRKDKDSVVHYSVAITKEEYGKSIVGTFFAKFFHSFGDTAMASFAESIEELPKDKKNYLLKLLEKQNENP